MFGRIKAALGVSLLCVSAASGQPPASGTAASGLERVFWGGVEALHFMFQAIGTLSGGPQRGAVWQFDIATRARVRVGSGTAFAWPIQGLDGQTVFALQAGQVVKVGLADGRETNIGPQAAWRKLIGVAPDSTILGLVQEAEGVQAGAVDARRSVRGIAAKHNGRGQGPDIAAPAGGPPVWRRPAIGGRPFRTGGTRVRCLLHHRARTAQCLRLR